MALRIDDVDLARDRALVERFQEGDPDAFDLLYRRYFDRLKRFCLKRVGDAHEAEEIAQEAFVRALRALPSFEGERRFYPWMTVIAGRLCVDVHRRRGRTEPSAEVDLGAVEGGQERIVEQADLALLGEALERVAPRHREVLELREQRGWSYQQIADHYDVSLGTVEALLFRARKALKREFVAIAGSDRNLAALPLLGFVVRRAASMRARVDGWLAAAQPLATPVVGAVMAVTTLGAAVGVALADGDRAGGAGREAIVRTVASTAAEPPTPAPVAVEADGAPAAVATANRRPEDPATSGRAETPRPVVSSPRFSAAGAHQVGADAGAAAAEEHAVQVPVVSEALVSLAPENVQTRLAEWGLGVPNSGGQR